MQSLRVLLVVCGLLVSSQLPLSAPQFSDSVVLSLRRDKFEVQEGDSGNNSTVLIEVDTMANTLLSQASLNITFSGNASLYLDYEISRCDDDESGSSFGSTSGSESGIESSGSGFSGSEFEMSSGGSGDMNEYIVTIFPGLFGGSVVCINITVLDDDTVESTENINISFVGMDSRVSFDGSSEALVYILDDDGVMLSIPDMLTIYEGESQEICVTIQNTYVPRERDVVVEFRVYPIDGSMTENDVNFTMAYVAIPIGMNETCTFIYAFDDSIVESTEMRRVTAVPLNQNDIVNGSTSVVILDNDGVMIQVPTDIEILEGNITQICVQITNETLIVERDVELTLTLPPGVTDIRAINMSVVIPPGNLQACFDIEAVDDDIIEPRDLITVTIMAVNPNDVVINGTTTITVIDNDGVMIQVPSDIEILEGNITQICVQITNETLLVERDVEVTLTIPPGVADIRAINMSVVIPPGYLKACFDIEAVDDDIIEPHDLITVTIMAVNPNDVVINGTTTITVIDNDGVMIEVPPGIQIIEGDVGQICVQITNETLIVERDVEVTLTIPPGVADIKAINMSVVIPPGNLEACFDIEAVDDDIIEPHDLITVTIMAVNPNDVVINGTTTITVIDNDVVELVISDEVVRVMEGEMAMICVNVTNGEQIRERHISPVFIVDVGSSFTEKGSDFLISNETFIITPNVSEACLNFEAIDDDDVEDYEMVTVTIMAEGEVVGNTTISIIDNDGATITLPDMMEVMEGDNFTVCATALSIFPLQRDVNLTFSVNPNSVYANDSDLMITSDPVVIIPALTFNSQGCITLEAFDDLIPEGNESFTITVMAANSLDMINGSTVINIADNDGVAVMLPEALQATEGDTFEVCANVMPTIRERDIDLTFTVVPSSEFADEYDLLIVNESMVTVPPQAARVCITLEANDDMIIEGTESFYVTVQSENSLDTVSGNTSVSVSDNDGARLSLVPYVNVTEGNNVSICVQIDENQPMTERDIPIMFTITRESMSARTSDYMIHYMPMTIPVGYTEACLLLEAVDDEIAEDTETLTVSIKATNDLDVVVQNMTTVSIIDNDGVRLTVTPTITLTEGQEQMLCVQLSEDVMAPERSVEVKFSAGAFGTIYTDESDYDLMPNSIAINMGMQMACVTLQATDDDLIEDEEYLTIVASPVNVYDMVAGNTSVNITDNDGAVVSFQNPTLTVEEAGDPFMICVELSNETSLLQRPVGVIVTFKSGSADILNDIQLVSTSDPVDSSIELEFVRNGDSVVCLRFNVSDDNIIENTEMFQGKLQPRLMEFDRSSMTNTVTIYITDNDGARVRLTDASEVSLIEGNSVSICVALEEGQIELLDRMVSINVSSDEVSMEGKATSYLMHDNSIEFSPSSETIMCIQVSIEIDMVYSVDRSFAVKFELVNERDAFNGANELIVAIVENGLQFLAINDLEGIKTVELGTDPEDSSDGFSDPIYFRGGFPVGTSTETVAHVGDNGIISFNRGYLFWEPSLFPTSDPAIRNSLVVAPFWSDTDIRRQGDIRYALIEAGSSTGKAEMALLNFVSGFIAAKEPKKAGNFSATSVLVAQWINVPPYPSGADLEELSPDEKEFVNLRNSFQGIVVTDGEQSFAIFTYNCNQLQWSGLFERHAVIGVNIGLGIEGDFPPFQNHPLSGIPEVTMVACANQDNGIEWSDLIYKIGDVGGDELQRNRSACMSMYLQDIQQFGEVFSFPSVRACPCSVFQAFRDRRFFLLNSPGRSSLCWFQTFPFDFPGPVQECCYSLQPDSFGALLGPSEDGEGGSVLNNSPLFSPQDYTTFDVGLRTTCCRDADLCDLYYERRPPSEDSCLSYRPLRFAWFWGDPHITTLDGRQYTFNGLGEYTLARIYSMNETDREFELQGRTTLVNGSSATQFAAFAFGLPTISVVEVRINETNDLEVLLSGTIQDQLSSNDSYFDSNVEIRVTESGDIETSFSNGISVTVSQQSGILDIVTSFPQSFMERPKGLLGNFNGNDTDDFVYPNGTMLEYDAGDRMIHYFGQSWEITATTSLFTYLPGYSAENFSFPDHMPRFLDEVVANASADIIALCGDNAECIFDATETGDTNVGLESLNTNQENNNDQMIISNLPPRVEGSTVFFINVGEESVYTFTVTDTSGEPTVMIENGLPENANLTNNGSGLYSIRWTFDASALPTFNRTLRIIARDDMNATTLLVPQLQLCACNQMGGNCTLEGLIDTVANPLTLNCECSLAYTGRFCNEDDNGCEELSCFMGVECTDVPAPGVGANCGPCPDGFNGDGVKCLDIDECMDNSTNNCQQICINTEGSFDCQCFPGQTPSNNTHCEDIDECATLNGGCHQVCDNEVGNFSCSCLEGYELDTDAITCVVLNNSICQNASICEQNCAVVNGTDTCSCNIGFMLAADDRSCPDVNECNTTVCDQTCNNTVGSFSCGCYEGFELGSDGRSCMDINECIEAALDETSDPLCSGQMMCNNTVGNFTCVCPPGTELYNGTCREICGMNFYRLSNNRCAACPEYSIRQLNQSESMCSCLSGYMRQTPIDVGQPCLPTVGFGISTVTFPEGDVTNEVVIPLRLSAYSQRDISLAFTVNPSTYMDQITNPTVIAARTTMQNLTLTIDGNNVPTDGDALFSITIIASDEFLLPATEGSSQYYTSVEVTIEEDDDLSTQLESNSLLITLEDLTVATFTAEVEERFRTTTANVINQYCDTQSCIPVSVSRRKRQGTAEVTADDIIIRDITNNAAGQLEFSMFVMTDNQFVLEAQTVEDAIEASTDEYTQNGFAALSVALLAPPTMTTSPAGPNPVGDLSTGAIVGIVIAALAVAVLLFLIVVVIIILVRRQINSKSFVLNTSYGFQYREKQRGSSLRELNGDAEPNIYESDRGDMPLTGGGDDEKMVSVQLTTLSERDGKVELEIFSNKAAEEPTKEMSLSDDIAQGLSVDIAKSLNEETQTVEISFDEPGEETKL